MRGLVAVLAAFIGSTASAAVPVWEKEARLLCHTTVAQTCQFGDWTKCEDGDLDSEIVISFQRNKVTEILGSSREFDIIAKHFRESVGTYTDNVVILDNGSMITLYQPDPKFPAIYQGVRQIAFLRQLTTTLMACRRMPD